MDEYTKGLEKDLSKAHETIGALVCSLEMVLEGKCPMTSEKIARTLIEKVRAERVYK